MASRSTIRTATAGALVALGYSAFEVALALGAPAGRYAWGGAHRVLPTELRVASALAAAVYLALAWALARARTMPLSRRLRRVMWVAAVAFALGIVMNLASPSWRERPHAAGAALLAVACLSVTRSTRPQAHLPTPAAAEEVLTPSRLRP